MSTVLGFIILVFWFFLQKCNSIYVGDSVTRMKMKIIQLDRELVLDAVRNVQRVDYLKDYYNKFSTYDIGKLLYSMRSKFARMIRLFTLSHDNLNIYDHNKHIMHLTEIQKLAMEMIALIEILQEWETKPEKRTNKYSALPKGFDKNQYTMKNMTVPQQPGNKNLRSGLLWAPSVPVNKPHPINMGNEKVDQIKRSRKNSKLRSVSIEGVAFDSDFY